MVYLDYNAATPVLPAVREAMLQMSANFGNPSSIHQAGRRSRAGIDDARERIASVLRCRAHEVIFTSGGTESNNLAILGLARHLRGKGRHLITVATEHHAVLHAFEYLSQHEGFALTLLPVDDKGLIDPDDLRKAIRPDTILVSVMSANNETGVIQDIPSLSAIARERGVLFHSDMIQGFGKLAAVPEDLGVDAASIAAHKFYGPKGAGCLYLRSGLGINAIHCGGSQENQRRPGTENCVAIVGMALAAELAVKSCEEKLARLDALREVLWQEIAVKYPAARRNGPFECTLGNTLNVSFPGCDGEALLMGLDLEGICVSSGSACMVGSVQPSHVLRAMGVSEDVAKGTVRFSLGTPTTREEIVRTVQALETVLKRQEIANFAR